MSQPRLATSVPFSRNRTTSFGAKGSESPGVASRRRELGGKLSRRICGQRFVGCGPRLSANSPPNPLVGPDTPDPGWATGEQLLSRLGRCNVFDCCRGAIDTSYDVACLVLCSQQRTVFASFWIKGGHFFCFFSRIKKRRSMIYAV